MASYTLAAAERGVHAKTLVANTVDTVTVAGDLSRLELYSDGAAKIYYTTDGSTPTVGGANTEFMPDQPSSREIRELVADDDDETVLKLKSSGTPTYHLQRI